MEEKRHTGSVVGKPLLAVLDGHRQAVPPVWLMRQAGRYLPEYREVREKAGGFLDLCFNPKLAAEVTLQPVRRFGFDAAILFSDILIVPLALGRRVEFTAGEGPKLEPLPDTAALKGLSEKADEKVFAPIYQTVSNVKAALDSKTALIGFCGAPWTVATYVVSGGATREQALQFASLEPDGFARLIDRIAQASITYLVGQLKAGAEVLQIFDTWAGVLPEKEFERWCVAPTKKIIDGVRAQMPDAKLKLIGFPRDAGKFLPHYVEATGINCIGLDWTIVLDEARALQRHLPVQGNLSPEVLRAGGDKLDHDVDAIMAALSSGPFIFNLGHGILPDTPIAHVERMLKRVRG